MSFAMTVALIASLLTGTLVTAPNAEAAVEQPFNAVFATQDNGAIALIGNSQMTCPATTSGCTAAQTGTATGGDLDDNNWAMAFIDADNSTSTSNSTSADLALPAGSTVLSAFLVWGGRMQTPALVTAQGNPATASFKVPGAANYTAVTGTLVRPSVALAGGTNRDPYQTTLDVTSQVAAAGNGTYWMGNLVAATGTDSYAGWSLIVAYRNPAAPLRDLRIYAGFADVTGTTTVNVPISGFLTPTTGTVNASVGVVSWEGDRGLTGDSMSMGGTPLSDAAHPADNFFYSSISDDGANITARNPNYDNALGVDIAQVNANGVLANSSRSTTVVMQTDGDAYYPGILTTQIDLFTPAFNPISKTVTDLSGNSPAKVGDVLQYQISLTNTGADPADLSVINDPLPAGVTYVPNSLIQVANPGVTGSRALTDATADDPGEYVAASRTVIDRVGSGASATTGGTIGINQTTTLQFKVTVNRASAGTTVSNVFTLGYKAHTIGANFVFTGNQVDSPVAPLADLQITKTSTPTSQTAGSSVVYTLTTTNNGPSAATNVVITDTLPVGITYSSANPPAGTSCSNSGQVITCVATTLANGGTISVPITTLIAPGTAAVTLTDQATVSADTADDVQANNSATATTVVTNSADLSVTKSVSPTTVHAGNRATYTIVVTNHGPSNANAVTLSDPVPAGETVVSATTSAGTCTVTGTAVACPIGILSPTGSATVTVVAAVNSNAGAGTVTNTATVSSTTPDPVATNNAAKATLTVDNSADLSITKTASAQSVNAGNALSYAITVTNNGPSDAANVTIADPAVPGLTINSASPAQGTCTLTKGEIDCALGTLAAGAAATVTVQATVDATTTAGPLTNTASVSSDTPDPSASDNSAAATVSVSTSADLSLAKKADPATITPGSTTVYTLTATNNGPSQATGAVVTDPLPAGLTFVSSADGCTAAGTTVTCAIGTMANGAVTAVSFTAKAASTATGTITNTAIVSATTPDPFSANNSATATSSTQPNADLSLTKSTSADPIAGGAVTYTLTATNNGPSQATSTVVTDPLPAGITFVSGSAPGGIACTATGQLVTCPLGALDSGVSVVITLVGHIDPAATGPSTNTAHITSAVTDPSPGNNTATSQTTIGAKADVAVTLAANPTTVTAGQDASFTLHANNNGPSVARNVVVTTQVPPGMTLDTHQATECTVSGSTLTCTLGDLDPGAAIDIPFTATVDSATTAGPLTATTEIGSATPDNDPSNNTSAATITVITKAALSITKTADPSPLVAGSAGNYTIVVTNNGPSDARQVVVTDSLDPELTAGIPSPSVGTCSVASQQITCTAPILVSGSSLTIVIPVHVASDATGSIGNTATAASSTPPTDNTDVTVHIDTPVVERANLQLTKTAAPEPVLAGTAVTYTLTASNNGPSDAAAVTLTDPMPTGLTVAPGGLSFSDGQCATSAASTQVDCDFGVLPAGATRTVVITALVPAGTAAGTSVTNTATLASPTPDTTPANRIASATSTITTAADLSITKVPVNDPAEAGSGQTYVISVDNHGPSVSNSVVVTDPLPAGVTFVSAQTSTGTCTFASGTVTCNLGAVAPGDSPTIQINVMLDPGIGGTILANTATVASTPANGPATTDPNLANNSSTVSQHVATRSNVTLRKEITSGTVVAGGTVTYLLTAANPGPSDAANLTITDPLPVGTTLISATPSDNGSCRSGSTVVCTWPTTAVGSTHTATLVISVPSATPASDPTDPRTYLSNTATVTSDSFDNDPSTATATATAPVTTSADLSMVKTVTPDRPARGAAATYTLKVHNAGPSDAENLTVLDDLAPELTNPQATIPGGVCTIVGQLVSCTAPSLGSGQDLTVTIAVVLAADADAGQVTNTASVTSQTPDPDPSNNTGSVSSTTARADLQVQKTANVTSVERGSTVVWTITVHNAGPDAARSVTVADLLPDEVTLVSTQPSVGTCTAESKLVNCSLGDLADDATATVLVTATVDATATTAVTNKAVALSPDESTPGDNTAEVTVALILVLDESTSPSTPPTTPPSQDPTTSSSTPPSHDPSSPTTSHSAHPSTNQATDPSTPPTGDPSDPPAANPGLPNTGVPVTAAIGWGLLLLLAGALVIAGSRRRRRQH